MNPTNFSLNFVNVKSGQTSFEEETLPGAVDREDR